MTIQIPLVWSDNLATGIAKIDEQHKVLVATLNEAHARLKGAPNKDLLDEITRNLLSYALYHFETEEDLMAEYGYLEACPENEHRHQEEHRSFSKTVVDLRKNIQEGQLVDRDELVTFLSQWLVNHIMKTDKHLGAFLIERQAAPPS